MKNFRKLTISILLPIGLLTGYFCADWVNFHYRHGRIHDAYMEGRQDGILFNNQIYQNEVSQLERRYKTTIENLKSDIEVLKKGIKK